MSEPSQPDGPEPVHPISLAMEWVSRIFVVSGIMFLPGLAGEWLDRQIGTGIWVLVGFGVGFCTGLAVLLAMVRPKKKKAR